MIIKSIKEIINLAIESKQNISEIILQHQADELEKSPAQLISEMEGIWDIPVRTDIF
jgi:hypothetical protein